MSHRCYGHCNQITVGVAVFSDLSDASKFKYQGVDLETNTNHRAQIRPKARVCENMLHALLASIRSRQLHSLPGFASLSSCEAVSSGCHCTSASPHKPLLLGVAQRDGPDWRGKPQPHSTAALRPVRPSTSMALIFPLEKASSPTFSGSLRPSLPIRCRK